MAVLVFSSSALHQVQAAQVDPQRAGKTQAEAEILDLFTFLQQAAAQDDGPKLASKLAAFRLIEEFYELTDLKLNFAQRLLFNTIVGRSLRSAVRDLFTGWSRIRIIRTDILDDGREARVLVRSWDEQGSTSRQWFWLIKTDCGWRYYDVEDLDVGIRFSMLMAGFSGETDRAGKTGELAWANENLQNAFAAVAAGDTDRARRFLQEVQGIKLPRAVEGLMWSTTASIELMEDNLNAAMEALDKADAARPGMPLVMYQRAVTCNLLGDYDRALAHAREYLSEIGDDADTYLEVGAALEGLGRAEEAIQAYQKGLDDTPDSVGNLAALGLSLPEDEKGEITDRFLRFRRPQELFEEVAAAFLEEEDVDALEAIVEGLERHAADDPNVAYYGAQAKFLRGQYEAAAAMLPPVFARVEDEQDRHFYVELYLDCMLQAGKQQEGYSNAPNKRDALEYLAGCLLYEDRVDDLEPLLDRFQADFPDDPLGHYYRGDMHFYRDEYTQADEAYARASAEGPDEDLQGLIRWSRIACWYHQGRALEAYREFGPDSDTFEQLAEMLRWDEKGKVLAELVALHERSEGRSAQSVHWLAQSEFLKTNYQVAVNLLTDQHELVFQDEDPEQMARCEDILIRSLLRMDRTWEALRHAKVSTARDDDPYFEVVVYAVQGDTGRCADAVEKCLDTGYYEFRDFLEDPDAGPALRGDLFAKLREEFQETEAQ
jgi:tetratricopeptide (TPR) repeat protein